MTNYNDGKWHGWNGGKCPVHPETVVEVAQHGDDLDLGKSVEFIWSHIEGDPYNIIAFRVTKEHKEPREFWVCGFEAFESLPEAECNCGNAADIIHVREVLSNET